MDIQSDIRQSAAGLQAGGTKRTICPFCNAQHERSLAITRDSSEPWKLLFNCHRGKCAQSGMVLDEDGAMLVLSPTAAPHRPDVALSAHGPLDTTLNEQLADHYSLRQRTMPVQGVKWEDESMALCMPWLDETGTQVGWVEKRFHPLWHKSHHELALGSYKGRIAFPRTGFAYDAKHNGGTAILVESLLDAYRLLAHAPPLRDTDPMPLALLGAQISSYDAFKLTLMFGNVVVLLDPDQWPVGSLRVARQFAALPINVRMMTLETDPKDATEDALDHLYDAIYEAF